MPHSVEQEVIKRHARTTVLAHPGGCIHRALQSQLRNIAKIHLNTVYRSLYVATGAGSHRGSVDNRLHNLLDRHLFLRAVFAVATLQFSYVDLKNPEFRTQTSKREGNWQRVGFDDPFYQSKRITIRCDLRPSWFLERLDNEAIRNMVVSAVITHDELPSSSVRSNDTVEPVYELDVVVRGVSYKWHPELTYRARTHATGVSVVNPSPLWQCARPMSSLGLSY